MQLGLNGCNKSRRGTTKTEVKMQLKSSRIKWIIQKNITITKGKKGRELKIQ